MNKLNKFIFLLSLIALNFSITACLPSSSSDEDDFTPSVEGVPYPYGAKVAITKKNILKMAKDYTPKDFEFVDASIVGVDNYYDEYSDLATNFNVTYKLRCTKDKYKPASRRNEIHTLDGYVVFVEKVLKKGDIVEVKGSGSYIMNRRYKKYELSASPNLYNFYRNTTTIEELKSKGYKVSNTIRNKDPRQKIRIIEIGAEQERIFFEEDKKRRENTPETLLGLWASDKYCIYFNGKDTFYEYSELTKAWDGPFSYSIGKDWTFDVAKNAEKTKISHISQEYFHLGIFVKNRRVLAGDDIKSNEDLIRKYLPANWTLFYQGCNVLEFAFNQDGTYVTTRTRVDVQTKSMIQSQRSEKGTWKIFAGRFVVLRDSAGKSISYPISSISKDKMTLGGDIYDNRKYPFVENFTPQNSIGGASSSSVPKKVIVKPSSSSPSAPKRVVVPSSSSAPKKVIIRN